MPQGVVAVANNHLLIAVWLILYHYFVPKTLISKLATFCKCIFFGLDAFRIMHLLYCRRHCLSNTYHNLISWNFSITSPRYKWTARAICALCIPLWYKISWEDNGVIKWLLLIAIYKKKTNPKRQLFSKVVVNQAMKTAVYCFAQTIKGLDSCSYEKVVQFLLHIMRLRESHFKPCMQWGIPWLPQHRRGNESVMTSAWKSNNNNSLLPCLERKHCLYNTENIGCAELGFKRRNNDFSQCHPPCE